MPNPPPRARRRRATDAKLDHSKAFAAANDVVETWAVDEDDAMARPRTSERWRGRSSGVAGTR